MKCDGTPTEVLSRLRAVATDWRDSARPLELRGIAAAPVSFVAEGPDGFRIETDIPGSRFFGAAAIGTVTESDGQTIIRYRTTLAPTLGRAIVQIAGLLTAFAALLALLRWSLSNFFLLPLIGTPLILIPSYATASQALDGHVRALQTLVAKAARIPRATP